MCDCFTSRGSICGTALIGGFNSALVSGATRWFGPNIGQSIDVGNSLNGALMPRDGIAERLVFIVDQDPGVGESITVSIANNQVPTALTITLNGGGGTLGENLTDKAVFLYKDEINFQVVLSAGCACTSIQLGCLVHM